MRKLPLGTVDPYKGALITIMDVLGRSCKCDDSSDREDDGGRWYSFEPRHRRYACTSSESDTVMGNDPIQSKHPQYPQCQRVSRIGRGQ